jgi:hypothetical protein
MTRFRGGSLSEPVESFFSPVSLKKLSIIPAESFR